MKIYTSYFAQMRNFPKYMVCLSTAAYDPKWLTRGQSQNGIFWFGIPPLKPGISCEGLCNGSCNPKHPQDCAFLKAYRAQLDKLDFDKIYEKIIRNARKVQEGEGFEDVDVALLVYEVPSNPCSERVVIQQWFKDHGVEIEEWCNESKNS